MPRSDRATFVLEEYCQDLQKEAESTKNKNRKVCHLAVVEMLEVFVANMRINRADLQQMEYTIELLGRVMNICDKHIKNFIAENVRKP